MSKSKSYPCLHPRTAVTGVSGGTNQTTYHCKKCNKLWVEVEPELPLSDVVPKGHTEALEVK